MNIIKAGEASIFLKNGGGAELLFGGLFSNDCEGVNVEISWGDILPATNDVVLSVRLKRVFSNEHNLHQFRFLSETNQPDNKMQAWADYFSGAYDTYDVDSFVPNCMLEDDVIDCDDEFLPIVENDENDNSDDLTSVRDEDFV